MTDEKKRTLIDEISEALIKHKQPPLADNPYYAHLAKMQNEKKTVEEKAEQWVIQNTTWVEDGGQNGPLFSAEASDCLSAYLAGYQAAKEEDQ